MEEECRLCGLLSPRSQETRPGKRISDFRQKSRRAFRLKRLNNAAPLEAEHRRAMAPTPGAEFKEL